MKNKSTRRQFISTSLLTGAATTLLPFSLLAEKPGQHENEMVHEEKPLIFLFQGDSITDGNRGRSADPNHIMGHGYAFSIASRVGADFPASGYQFFNRGVSGNTVIDLQKRWQADTLDIRPALVSILVGINDAAGVVENRPAAQTASDFENMYRKLIQDTQTVLPNTMFVLGVPFVYPVGKRKDNWEKWQSETMERAEKVRKLAKEFDAVLVDYPEVFDKAITAAPAAYWIWDGVHPTVAAHELMAREWIKQTAKRLHFLKKYHY